MQILTVMGLFILLVVCMTLFVKIYTQGILTLMTHRKHKDIEYLIHTEHAPETWKKRWQFKIALLCSDQKARNLAIKRAKKLHDYITRTPLVDSEEQRESAKNSLEDIYTQWDNLSWNELFVGRLHND